MIELTDHIFDPLEVLAQFTNRTDGAGAIVSFTGLVRPETKSSPVTSLHLQAYSPMTELGILGAVQDSENRWPLTASHVVHRIGDMKPGEPIVFVATAAAHRRAAFKAADYLMDYLKTEAIFWKKETGVAGENWIEPRPEDYSDASRWKK